MSRPTPAPRVPIPTPATACGVLVLAPVAAVFLNDALRAWIEGSGSIRPDGASYAWTIGVALAIGLLATALGLPLAFASAGSSARLALLAFLPLATPTYLASSAYGMLRNKAWFTGEWLARYADEGHPWLTTAVDRALAVVGLSMWAAPIAALILAPAAAAARASLHDPLTLDTRGIWRRLELLRSLGHSPGLAILGVGVLMIGSAIPLHLARVPTAAVNLWAAQDLAPVQGRGAVWLSAWPLIVAALAASLTLTRGTLGDSTPATNEARAPASSRSTKALVLGVLVAGTLVPLGFFAAAVEQWTSAGPNVGVVRAFFQVHGGALLTSLGVAAVAGLCVTVLSLWTAHAASDGSRMALRLVAAGWLCAALMPGMLVGALTARVWISSPGPAWLSDPASLLHAHLLRLGALGVLAGLAFAKAEPLDRRDARRLDGPRTFLNWWRACGSASPAWWICTFLAAWALSLNEIEATVVVQPPGLPSLARKILGDLHFYRTQDMAVAVLTQLTIVAVVCGVAAVIMGRARAQTRAG